MLSALLAAGLGVFVTALAFVAARRRRTHWLDLDLDRLPAIEEGLSAIAGLTGSTVFTGNQATVFQNGPIFDAMERDLWDARHSIHLETFVWSAGALERRMVDLLCTRAGQGVKVRVIVDAVGASEASAEQLDRLRDSGVSLVVYRPLLNRHLRRLNHRTHRKLLVVDGSIAYTFGHGIADQWLGEGDGPDHWRDTGVRLTGPIVHGLQSVFVDHWIESTQAVPCEADVFPVLQPAGPVIAHVVRSGAGDPISSVALLYTLAIASARRVVRIQNPYFVPGPNVVRLLKAMVKRGVKVQLMVPGRQSDNRFVRHAGCHLYAGLLEAGIELFEFQPAAMHQKVLVVDGVWSHIGSTNFDARSLALNEEAGVGLLDVEVARQLDAAFDEDLASSRHMTPERWHQRGRWRRATEWIAYLLHEQL